MAEEPDFAEPFDPFHALASENIPVPVPLTVSEDPGDTVFEPVPDFTTYVVSNASSTLASLAVNPKEVAGSKKPGVWSVFPRWVSLIVGRVMETGASKYGKFNYRDTTISASVYEDAMERHSQLWFDGEDNDPESGVSHLAHVIACATILLDAQRIGRLDDNRQKTGIVRSELANLEALRKVLPFPGNKL